MHDRNVSLPAAIAALTWLVGFGLLTYDFLTPDGSQEVGRLALALCCLASAVTGWAIACSATKQITRDLFELGRDTGRLEAERGMRAVR